MALRQAANALSRRAAMAVAPQVRIGVILRSGIVFRGWVLKKLWDFWGLEGWCVLFYVVVIYCTDRFGLIAINSITVTFIYTI